MFFASYFEKNLLFLSHTHLLTSIKIFQVHHCLDEMTKTFSKQESTAKVCLARVVSLGLTQKLDILLFAAAVTRFSRLSP